MDKIDIFAFLLWSAFLAALDFSGWQLLICQLAWLTVYYLGRSAIDRWVARR